ncbi:MAG TPA: DUF433 domain-containing protein [Candidatus Nanoarchaeia archaeon]
MPKSNMSSKKYLVPGSQVPIAFLIDYLKEGYSISDFISSYPWIKKSKVQKALDEIKNREFTATHAL